MSVYNPSAAALEMSPVELISFWALEHEAAERTVVQHKPGTVPHFNACNVRARAYSQLLAAQDAAAGPDARRLQEWHNDQAGAHYYGFHSTL